MNLLLSRSQSGYKLFKLLPLRFGRGVIFNLHAEVEFTPEERDLLRKYHLEDARINDGKFWPPLRESIAPALIATIISMIPIILVLGLFSSILGIGLPIYWLLFLVFLGWLFAHFWDNYDNLRIIDLMNGGRTFRCDGVVSLIRREYDMERACIFIRQVLESARHWHDREAIAVPALSREDARKVILTASPI